MDEDKVRYISTYVMQMYIDVYISHCEERCIDRKTGRSVENDGEMQEDSSGNLEDYHECKQVGLFEGPLSLSLYIYLSLYLSLSVCLPLLVYPLGWSLVGSFSRFFGLFCFEKCPIELQVLEALCFHFCQLMP